MSPPGLRARVTLLFSAGALLLSTGLAVSTYHLTARHLLAERERTAIRAAYFDAAVVAQGLNGDNPDVVEVMRALDTGKGRVPLLRREGTWFARSADDGLTAAVPPAMLKRVNEGTPVLQRIDLGRQPGLVVGIPLPSSGSAYFEVQSLAETDSTLRTLSGILAAVAAVATVAAALLSSWTSRAALRPLRQVIGAASRVSEGDLSVRIQTSDDPDLGQLARAFNRMIALISERIERDQRFAADVSHELRSPLQTLTAASAVLWRHSETLDERTGKASRLVAQEAERFSDLVRDLLELARADTPLQLAPTDVHDLLQRACSRTGTPDSVLLIDPEVSQWPLDGRRYEQLVVNLLDNARRHGGGTTAVTARVENGRLVLDVDDSGPGIPPRERERAFDRFARGSAANARGSREGTGLGLALVSQHAAAHDGDVQILDRPGGGCRLRVTVPAVRRIP